MRKMGWMAFVGMAGLGGACVQGPSSRVAITTGQLEVMLDQEPRRLEVQLAEDGSVREVRILAELGHEDQMTGRVMALDAATGDLTLDLLGGVSGRQVTRYRTSDESRADGGAWRSAVATAVAGGQPVWVDARGAFTAGTFAAQELRWEDGGRTKIEADVDAGAFDDATGLLVLGGLELDLTDVDIWTGDDHGLGDDDLADDHGLGDDDAPDTDED